MSVYSFTSVIGEGFGLGCWGCFLACLNIALFLLNVWEANCVMGMVKGGNNFALPLCIILLGLSSLLLPYILGDFLLFDSSPLSCLGLKCKIVSQEYFLSV